MTTTRKTDHGLVLCSEGQTLFIPRDDLPHILLAGAELLQEQSKSDNLAQTINGKGYKSDDI